MNTIRFRFQYVDNLSFKVKLYEIRGWDCPWDCGLITQLVQQHATITTIALKWTHIYLKQLFEKQSLTPSTTLKLQQNSNRNHGNDIVFKIQLYMQEQQSRKMCLKRISICFNFKVQISRNSLYVLSFWEAGYHVKYVPTAPYVGSTLVSKTLLPRSGC